MKVYTRGGKPIKAWVDGVPVEDAALAQLANVSKMPFIHKHVAVMPDVHKGIGATVGSVIATKGAIIPAAVGVDIGCGMTAVRTSLTASELPDNLAAVRTFIEVLVPHGRSSNGGPGDKGAWDITGIPGQVYQAWGRLNAEYEEICSIRPAARSRVNPIQQLGTLGTGNHFVEVCLDEEDRVWVMLHSGSRGAGNKIGRCFIELAKRDMEKFFIHLPDADLAYFPQNTNNYTTYVRAVEWAQLYARVNRAVMMDAAVHALQAATYTFEVTDEVISCHHNYVALENHYGTNVHVTRKGAVRARKGDLGIIPGSMGTRSYIVRGKGNPESFHSCSHGAGRVMSRTAARKTFTVEDHVKATEGIECRKDEGVIDETPGAYKNIDAVMAAQADLVDIVHTLRQVVCVKG